MHIASPPQDRVHVAEAGGLELVVAALNAHPENATVRKNGAVALFTFVNDEDGLGCGSEEMLGSLIAEEGGLEAVVSAFRASLKTLKRQKAQASDEVISWLRLVGKLAQNAACRSRLEASRGIELTIAAMNANPRNSKVREAGARALHGFDCDFDRQRLDSTESTTSTSTTSTSTTSTTATGFDCDDC
jgi:hypothetical protein